MNDKLKYEVASELGIDTSKIQNGYWGHLTSRECGAIGGHMIRKLMATAEEAKFTKPSRSRYNVKLSYYTSKKF